MNVKKLFGIGLLMLILFFVTSCSGSKIENMNKEIESLTLRNQELESERIDLLGEIKSLKSNLVIIEETLNLSKVEIDVIVGEMNLLKHSIEGLILRNSLLESNIEVLIESNNSLILLSEGHKQNINEIKIQNMELEAKIDELKIDSANLNDMLDLLYEQVLELSRMSVKRELIEYLDSISASAEYRDYFFLSTTELFDENKASEYIIDFFNISTKLNNVNIEQEEGSQNATITFQLPTYTYNDVAIKIYYKEILIVELTDEQIKAQSFDYNFPHYGQFRMESTFEFTSGVIFTDIFDVNISSSEYEFAFLNGTLPVLMYATEMFNGMNKEIPTYLMLQRPETLDWTKLPNKTSKLPNFILSGGSNWFNFSTWVYNVADWIKELHEINPDSTFKLNVVDNYTGIAIALFDHHSIPTENYEVNIWTDGTFTYTALNSYTNEAVLSSNISDIKAKIENAPNLTRTGISYEYLSDTTGSKKYSLAYAYHMPNVNYYVSTLDGILYRDPLVTAAINETITLKSVQSLFNNLKQNGDLVGFEYMLKTRWGEEANDGMAHYFNSPKGKYLLVLGTSLVGENTTASNKFYNFNTSFDKVVELYGDEYEIFYKGHPSFPSSIARQTYFKDNDILELNKSIPVEVLMYIYPNVYVGGYSGSSFLSSMQDQTLFFYGTKAHVKSNTQISDMIDETSIFDNTIYIYDESIT